MAGIKVPQYDIFKIGTKKLKYYDWNLTITKKEAFKCEEIVSLFEAQEFRLIAKILNKPITEIDFTNYLLVVKIEHPKDFNKAVDPRGITINGSTFRRFVGTTGGLKNNTLLFANTEILDELNKRCECNRKEIQIVPAKLEAYKALTCSASQPICDPKGILVVSDCVTKILSDVINIDDSSDGIEPDVYQKKNEELENTVSDGFNLCTIDYMKQIAESLDIDYIPSGVCLRNAWLKGMLYPFPIIEFVEKYSPIQGDGKYYISDIWGNLQDIRECDIILTESSLKLWSAYDNIEDYIKSYHENGYEFAVTKITSNSLEDQRELNYQYLQSYEFTDEDIKELCAPTVKYLKDACGEDYHTAIKFLGISEQSDKYSWQRALYESEYMLGDPYIIDSIHRMIRKRIDEAKIGKLLVEGNYQLASGDPFALMQHICGLKVTGLLKAEQIYSSYWVEKQVHEVVVFRSPMTSHNNIRRCEVVDSPETKEWYKYMNGIMILNGFDSMCQSLNGCDYDGDLIFSTNNNVLLRRHKKLPAILCIQRNVEKIFPTEEDILRTDRDAMGNRVGSITNRVTAMMEVQSHFNPDSEEFKELSKRIECGQLYQQNEIDKIKGIVAKPMPDYWYLPLACGEDQFLRSICVNKRPYFMTYVYADYRVQYRDYLKMCNKSCYEQFDCSIEELQNKKKKTKAEKDFIKFYEYKNPFGMGPCAMNRICYYIEQEFEGIVPKLKKQSSFDYRLIKYDGFQSDEMLCQLTELCEDYTLAVKKYKENKKHDIEDKEQGQNNRVVMKSYYRQEAKKICPDDHLRMNTILDITYMYNGNKQFCWDCVGALIVARLKECKL